MRRIGILGGTFDPIHTGHIDIGAAAETALRLTRLFVIPSNVPPHRPQPNASAFHRFAMAALTVAGRPTWQASDLELRDPSPSYTSSTLTRFRDRGYSPRDLYFIIGADAFIDLPSWKDYPGILESANFAVVSRPGCSIDEVCRLLPQLAAKMRHFPLDPAENKDPIVILIEAATADVSSTAIRQRRLKGQSIAGLVDPGVQQHIERHGLYTSDVPGRRGSDEAPSPAAGRLHGQS